ncbi:hypothetical protein GQ457_01G013300 [Hibiscus cannabinus]
MSDRYSGIVNSLNGYDEVISEDKLIRKMIYSFSNTWDSKKTTIIDTMNLKTLKLDELIGLLLTHEMMSKGKEEKKKEIEKKNIGIALKPTKGRVILVKMMKRRRWKCFYKALQKCGQKIGLECGESVVKAVLKGQDISKKCCVQLVHKMGRSCHEDLLRYLISQPKIGSNATHVFTKGPQVYNSCVSKVGLEF